MLRLLRPPNRFVKSQLIACDSPQRLAEVSEAQFLFNIGMTSNLGEIAVPDSLKKVSPASVACAVVQNRKDNCGCE